VRARIRRYWKQLIEVAEETQARRAELGMTIVPLGGRNQEQSKLL